MTKLNELYKCQACSNIAEIVHTGEGELVCCGKPMQLLIAGAVDGAKEKHIPVIEKTENGYLVKIGSVPHPMLPEHYIELIEIMTDDGKVGRKYLNPGDKPEATFTCKASIVYAREYCNIHGLWSTK
ncbi:MAG: desulfoferrodoxin [Endomicrobium sp.]|jgi:superoxide reductase|nr:desulfoferrodoxin [Endomicrobium sp.]